MKSKSLKVNFIFNSILTISGIVFPLITFPYISRVLGPEGVGKVSFALSFVSYLCVIAQLGTPTYGIRICAKVRDDKEKLSRTVQELMIINLVMTAFAYLVFAILLIFVPRFQGEKTLYIITSAVILLNSVGMEWLYQALEKYSYIAIRSIVFKVVAIVAMFLLVKSPDHYLIYGAISIFASSASNILNLINARKHIIMRPLGNYDFKRHIKAVLIFFGIACATTIYTNLDVVMLGFMKEDAVVGYYQVAIKIKTLLLGVITALGAVVMPRVSYYIEQGKTAEYEAVCKKAMNFILVFASSMSLFFMIFAKESVLLISGESYIPSVIPMQIIMPTLLIIGITNIMGMEMLIPMDKEKVVLISVAIGALVDLILNFILIPSMGAAGAAVGTLAAEAAVLIVQVIVLKGQIKMLFGQVQYWKILVGLLIASGASFWVKFLGLGSFITLLVGAVIFFVVYGLWLLIVKETLVKSVVSDIAVKRRK